MLLSRLTNGLIGSPAIPRGTRDGQSHIEGVPDELAIEIDKNGSPVTIQAADWFVCFVPGLQRQWWHRFTNPKHKHVFALRMVSQEKWILFEPWWTRIMVSVLNLDEAVKYLRWGAAGNILKVKETIPGGGSQARGWSNCAVLISFLLGRSYWTWTPHGLYRRLTAESGTQVVDLTCFLSEQFMQLTNDIGRRAFETIPANNGERLETRLLDIGHRLTSVMMSSSVIGLYRVAVSESGRYPSVSRAYFEEGPHQGINHVKHILEAAKRQRQIDMADCELGARQFISLFRGNLHLQVLLGLRDEPEPTTMNERVSSAVNLFLHGVCFVPVKKRELQ